MITTQKNIDFFFTIVSKVDGAIADSPTYLTRQ